MSAIAALPVSAVFCTALLLFSPVVRAGPVRIVSQNRFVDAVAEEPGPRRQESREDASDFGPFNQRAQVTTPGAVGLAIQDSMLSITPNGALFTATGSATGSVRVPVHAESMFGVTFDVALPLPYRLNIHGDFPTGAPPPTFSFTGPLSGGPLQGPDQNITGILSPGTYHFAADAASPDASFIVNFSMGTAIPLPPALWASIATFPFVLFGIRSLSHARGVQN